MCKYIYIAHITHARARARARVRTSSPARMDRHNENRRSQFCTRGARKCAAKRVEITAERNSHELSLSLSHIDPIVLPLIVAMGTSNTATKRPA